MPSRFEQPTLLIVGCGDVGLRVVRLMQGRWRLLALTSSAERMPLLRAAGAVPMLGDLDHPASLLRLGSLADAVLHLAPPPGSGTGDPRTGALLRALARHPRVTRIVYGSTSGVYGDCGGACIDETRTVAPATDRARRRVDAERQLRAHGRGRGVRVTILRIPGIYAGNRPGGAAERLRRGTPVLADADDVYTNHIHADDLARACVAALHRGRPQRVVHASDDTDLKMGAYFDLAADLLQLPRPPRVPRDGLGLQLSPMQMSFMSESRRLDNRRLTHELRLRLRYPTVAEGLLATPADTDMKTLLITEPLPAAYFRKAIHALAPDIDLVDHRHDLDPAALAEIDVVLAWQFPAGVAGRLPNLKWVCSIAAGVEKLLVPDLPPGVPVSRIVDAEQAEGIAQFVALMALSHVRGLPTYEAQQARREWRRWPIGAVRSRVAVLGMGTMGSAVARVLGAVGFSVRGWTRRSAEPLPALLGASDIVVCALPLTPETDGLFDAEMLALLPQGAYLINIARGAHVVEPDLIAAVQRGHLAGAALDVQRHEPMAADDPLWQVPGITITPHIAAQSSPATIAAQFVAGLRCLERGDAPPQQVDRQRGY